MKRLIVIAATVLAVSFAPVSASAQYRSYFDMMQKWPEASQERFATKMISKYERTTKIYLKHINKHKAKHSNAAWYKRMKSKLDWQLGEIAKYTAFLNPNDTPQVAEKTITNTVVEKTAKVNVIRKATVEVSRSTVIEEERTDTMVREYNVTTVNYETPVKTIHYTLTKTTTYWSDGTNTSATKTSLDSKNTVNETNSEVFRELIREYAIVIEQNEVVEEENTTTAQTSILTVEEYLARDDVDYTEGSVYYDAVKNVNSNINDDYTNNVLGKYYGNNLKTIGAPDAWARGYTGLGSKIAIFDTGIDVDNTEFEGRIDATKCFTGMCEQGYETIDDGHKWSHGTHVAGIAAAALDGKGTTGVAPDANLLIGKLAYNGGFYDFEKVDEAIGWAVNNGADVINMSAGSRTNNSYRNSLTKIDTGVYISDHEHYGKYGYNQLFKDGNYGNDIIEAMKGHETVFVLSAGNDRQSVVTPEAHIAVNSEVGDRVLVVGMYDARKQDINKWSNAAGTVCFETKADGTCVNDRRISDQYIVAPGTWVAGPADNNEYKTLTGTSQAAPHVAGAVAIVHQMWPHMTGDNLAKLLLDTASTDEFKNYSVERHGQGMLDLEEATSPQGALGIPTTGRVNGGTVTVNSGTLAMSAGSLASLEEVMVIDDYDRDFYFNANNMMVVNDTRTTSTVKAAQVGVQPDNYIGYTGGQIVPMQNVALAINDDTGESTIAVNYDGFTLGMQNERGSFLGNVADSDIMRIDGAQTTYIGYQFDNGNLFGNMQLGATSLDVDSSTLLKSADTLMSYSASIGAKQTVGNSTFGATVSVPVTITSGHGHFEVASSVSSMGSIDYENSSSSLATQKQEIDYGLFINTTLSDYTSLETFAEVRTNYAGTADDTVEFGLNYRVNF